MPSPATRDREMWAHVSGAETEARAITSPAGHTQQPAGGFVSALYVETGGAYFGLPGVDPWDEARDARLYDGPYPVVAHPPCQVWGRYGASHPILGAKYREYGQDGGCFEAALDAIDTWGGVVEHPAYSKAWAAFGLTRPPYKGGWVRAGSLWTCHVEQGHYGHFSRKPTWLLYRGFGPRPPELIWGRSEQRLPAYAIERYGYEKARRIGVMAAVGGRHKTRIRNATPEPFRDLLLSIARSVHDTEPHAPPEPDFQTSSHPHNLA